MLTLKKIAVTGGIASGKSTVCRLFKELGAYVISADVVVHQLLSPNTDLGRKVIALLGPSVVVKEELSREAIARLVFRDPHLLKHLEQLIHPEVQRIIEAQYTRIVQHSSPYTLFVVEVPLLFESGQETFYDVIVAVLSDDIKAKERFIKTTSYDAEEYTRRSQQLLSSDEKRKRADFTIENNGNLSELKHEVIQLHNQLTRR